LLAKASRQHHDLQLGLSPRGSLMLLLAARSKAFLSGRNYVLPDDVHSLFEPVLSHRIILRPESRMRKKTIRMVLDELLTQVSIPAI